MQDKDLSQWFNLKDQKPWEIGVYEVLIGTHRGEAHHSLQGWFAYWDGMKFKCSSSCKTVASRIRDRNDLPSIKVFKWRGLSSNPTPSKPKPRGNPKVTRYVVMRKSEPPAPVATYRGWVWAARKANELTLITPHRHYVVKVRHRSEEASK